MTSTSSTTESRRASILIWNRTAHLLSPPPFAAEVTIDSTIAARVQQECPDLIWMYGPVPPADLLTQLHTAAPALRKVAMAKLDLATAGEGVQIIGGYLDKAKQFVKVFKRLQSMPAVAQRVMAAVDDENTTAKELVALVAPDPALAATILKHANSPLHGLTRKVTDIQSAVVILGLRQVGELAMAASVMDLFQEKDEVADAMWKRRLLIAATATRLGRKIILDPMIRKSLFVAGLLHDIGLSVLRHMQPEFIRMHLTSLSDQENLYRETVKMFDYHPGDLGAALAQQWNLPEEVEIPARFHHTTRIFDTGVVQGPLNVVLWTVMVAVAVANALIDDDRATLAGKVEILSQIPQIDHGVRQNLSETVEVLMQELSQAMSRKAD